MTSTDAKSRGLCHDLRKISSNLVKKSGEEWKRVSIGKWREVWVARNGWRKIEGRNEICISDDGKDQTEEMVFDYTTRTHAVS